MSVCVCACVHACVRACMRACACVRACVCVCEGGMKSTSVCIYTHVFTLSLPPTLPLSLPSLPPTAPRLKHLNKQELKRKGSVPVSIVACSFAACVQSCCAGQCGCRQSLVGPCRLGSRKTRCLPPQQKIFKQLQPLGGVGKHQLQKLKRRIRYLAVHCLVHISTYCKLEIFQIAMCIPKLFT